MSHPVWDPVQYGRYAQERARPALELMARIGDLPAGGALVDLGCGGGEALAALAARFPGREAIGVDLSPDMLAKGRAATPALTFVEGDFTVWRPSAPPALIFSNAALHWVSGHRALVQRWFGFLAPGGWLALQMPNQIGQAAHEIAQDICRERGWVAALRAQFDPAWTLPAPQYYDALAEMGAARIDLWEATFWHALGPLGVTDWMKGTALRPVLSALAPADQAAFLADYDARVRAAYPPARNGATLYPQRRVFVVAQRPGE